MLGGVSLLGPDSFECRDGCGLAMDRAAVCRLSEMVSSAEAASAVGLLVWGGACLQYAICIVDALIKQAGKQLD